MKTLVAALCAALLCSAVQSAPILIDFEGQSPQYHFGNYTLNGMQFSPLTPTFIVKDKLDRPGTYLATDSDNNYVARNPNYLGGTYADLWIDRFGDLFSFLGLESVAPYYNNAMSFEVRSSKGGFFEHHGSNRPFSFSGDLWTDVQWITLNDPGDGFHRNHGWDNLQFEVRTLPEPSTALLVGLAGLGLWAVRRRRIG